MPSASSSLMFICMAVQIVCPLKPVPKLLLIDVIHNPPCKSNLCHDDDTPRCHHIQPEAPALASCTFHKAQPRHDPSSISSLPSSRCLAALAAASSSHAPGFPGGADASSSELDAPAAPCGRIKPSAAVLMLAKSLRRKLDIQSRHAPALLRWIL